MRNGKLSETAGSLTQSTESHIHRTFSFARCIFDQKREQEDRDFLYKKSAFRKKDKAHGSFSMS